MMNVLNSRNSNRKSIGKVIYCESDRFEKKKQLIYTKRRNKSVDPTNICRNVGKKKFAFFCSIKSFMQPF